MKIDLSKLLKGLEALPHTPTPEPENVPPYVLTHILAPLKMMIASILLILISRHLPKKILTACTVHCLMQRTGSTA